MNPFSTQLETSTRYCRFLSGLEWLSSSLRLIGLWMQISGRLVSAAVVFDSDTSPWTFGSHCTRVLAWLLDRGWKVLGRCNSWCSRAVESRKLLCQDLGRFVLPKLKNFEFLLIVVSKMVAQRCVTLFFTFVNYSVGYVCSFCIFL